jgi:hypothetical protein
METCEASLQQLVLGDRPVTRLHEHDQDVERLRCQRDAFAVAVQHPPAGVEAKGTELVAEGGRHGPSRNPQENYQI